MTNGRESLWSVKRLKLTSPAGGRQPEGRKVWHGMTVCECDCDDGDITLLWAVACGGVSDALIG